MNKVISFFLASIILLQSAFYTEILSQMVEEPEYESYISEEWSVPMEPIAEEIEELHVPMEPIIYKSEETTEPVVEEEIEYYLSEEDIRLIALITMAEAENQPELGQRLVIDTILNRVNCDAFPNTVHEVIYAPAQFSCVWNGRVNRCYVKDELVALVKEELISQINYEVVFFTAGGYAGNGAPLFQVGDHYFERFY